MIRSYSSTVMRCTGGEPKGNGLVAGVEVIVDMVISPSLTGVIPAGSAIHPLTHRPAGNVNVFQRPGSDPGSDFRWLDAVATGANRDTMASRVGTYAPSS
jgi:hypothetical protein